MVLWLPVAARIGLDLGIDPMACVVCIVFAASWSFITPFGYQTNLMVFGPGGYRIQDMVRYGVPLTILATLLVPLLTVWQFGL